MRMQNAIQVWCRFFFFFFLLQLMKHLPIDVNFTMWFNGMFCWDGICKERKEVVSNIIAIQFMQFHAAQNPLVDA